jgi:hypothetical protein
VDAFPAVESPDGRRLDNHADRVWLGGLIAILDGLIAILDGPIAHDTDNVSRANVCRADRRTHA